MRGDRVLLQRRAGTGYMDGMWVAGAAGHIEWGETAQAAAVRETAEELGIGIDLGALRPLTVMQRTDGTLNPREQRADWFFAATEWTGEPAIREPEKCEAIEWFPLSALPDAIPHYERVVLDMLARGDVERFTSVGFGVDSNAYP